MKNLFYISIVIGLFLSGCKNDSNTNNTITLNELKAFPTAEGAGAYTSGGRGGRVIYVTNRNVDGNGSLKQALLTEGKRTIVFAIGGRFDIEEEISLGQRKANRETNDTINEDFDKYSHFTLAGQTANDKGGVHLTKEEHNLILRDKPIASPYKVSVLDAHEVKSNILNNVGGNIRFKEDGTTYIDDEIDKIYINHWAKNNGGPKTLEEYTGTTALGNSVRFVYPQYSTKEAVDLEQYDTDRDGMPNSWELSHYLNPQKANNNAIRADRKWYIGDYLVINNAGYTDLEMYLADIAGDFHILVND